MDDLCMTGEGCDEPATVMLGEGEHVYCRAHAPAGAVAIFSAAAEAEIVERHRARLVALAALS